MINITIRFGATGEITKQFARGTRAAAVLGDAGIKSVLGFGDNVQALVDGQVLNSNATLNDGDVLVVETRANSKA